MYSYKLKVNNDKVRLLDSRKHVSKFGPTWTGPYTVLKVKGIIIDIEDLCKQITRVHRNKLKQFISTTQNWKNFETKSVMPHDEKPFSLNGEEMDHLKIKLRESENMTSTDQGSSPTEAPPNGENQPLEPSKQILPKWLDNFTT